MSVTATPAVRRRHQPSKPHVALAGTPAVVPPGAVTPALPQLSVDEVIVALAATPFAELVGSRQWFPADCDAEPDGVVRYALVLGMALGAVVQHRSATMVTVDATDVSCAFVDAWSAFAPAGGDIDRMAV